MVDGGGVDTLLNSRLIRNHVYDNERFIRNHVHDIEFEIVHIATSLCNITFSLNGAACSYPLLGCRSHTPSILSRGVGKTF